MDEKYGDGSDHTVCEKCGLCVTCGDCKCDAEADAKQNDPLQKIKKRMEKLRKHGQQRGWKGTLAATYVRDIETLLAEIYRLQGAKQAEEFLDLPF